MPAKSAQPNSEHQIFEINLSSEFKRFHRSGNKAFVPLLKSHVIPSIESFDDLIDKGFATTVLSNGDGEVPLAFGMTAEISYQAFLWDPARAIMLSFADSYSSGNLSFVLADDDEEEVQTFSLTL